MKATLIVLSAILAASLFMAGQQLKAQPQTNSAIHQAFNTWSQKQNKLYLSPAEKDFRRQVFAAHFEKVSQMNKMYTHKSALNMFSDMTEEEFVSKYTGLKNGENRQRGVLTHQISYYAPEQVDWRTKGAVNPVKNQGQCGSCWAFSATSALESANFIKNGQLHDLSEQQLVDCSSSFGNNGCNGGLMDDAFKYIKSVGGQQLTSDYPYMALDGKCKFQKSQAKATVASFTDVPKSNCASLVDAISKQPVSVAIAANAIMHYQSGVFANAACGTGLNHGVVAVGYGTDNGHNYFTVRNSWGSAWGEEGYIRMSRDVQKSTGICGICLDASYPTAA